MNLSQTPFLNREIGFLFEMIKISLFQGQPYVMLHTQIFKLRFISYFYNFYNAKGYF